MLLISLSNCYNLKKAKENKEITNVTYREKKKKLPTYDKKKEINRSICF